MIKISATNRGSKRVESDFYSTPHGCIDDFLNNHKLQHGDILEPSAGNGNIVKAIRDKGYKNHITSLELRREERGMLNKYSDKVIIDDFLTWKAGKRYKTIIGNPPYSLALDFIKKSLDLLDDDGELIFLLRTALLESKKRYNFWQKNPVNKLYVVSNRPSFTGKGSDATSYSWFVWKKNTDKQEINVIWGRKK